MTDERVDPSSGWGVLHLFYTVERAVADPGSAKLLLDALDAFVDDDHQVLVFTVLGHKADLGVMAVGPDLARLQQLQQGLAVRPLRTTWSYVSLTETSEYTATDDDERTRLAAEERITDAAEVEARLVAWRERMAHYRENRLHPRLPAKRAICFYPMSKRRAAGRELVRDGVDRSSPAHGRHTRVGRGYAGRVLQLITGSTGLDDWEWGVTLLADDPAALKEIVYEMRFDEVSSRFAEFGPFVTGLVYEPAEALRRVGITG